MARKTLKQKLKSQLRKAKEVMDIEYEQAGLTINFETQAMQSVALGFGVMATLLEAKKVLGEESESYKQIQEISQIRIAQCFTTLVGMGISPLVANERLMKGY